MREISFKEVFVGSRGRLYDQLTRGNIKLEAGTGSCNRVVLSQSAGFYGVLATHKRDKGHGQGQTKEQQSALKEKKKKKSRGAIRKKSIGQIQHRQMCHQGRKY